MDEAIIRIKFEDSGTGPTSETGKLAPSVSPPPEQPTQSSSEEQQEAERDSAVRLLIEALDRLHPPPSPEKASEPISASASPQGGAGKESAGLAERAAEKLPLPATEAEKPPESPAVLRVRQPRQAKPYDYAKQKDEDRARSSLDKVADLFENFGGRLGGSLGRLTGSIGNLLSKIAEQRVKPPKQLAPMASLVPQGRPVASAEQITPAAAPSAASAPVIPTAQVAPAGATCAVGAVAKPANVAASVPFALPAPPGAKLTPGAVATRVPPPLPRTEGGDVPQSAAQPSSTAARGSDTVPAMLTPGEVVIPKDKAAQNRPLIDQMLGNKQPEHHASGGFIQYRATGGAINSMLAMAGPAGSVAVAAFEVFQAFKDTLTGATRQLGEFATALADPDANPAPFVANLGKGISAAGDAIFYISPAASILVGVLGEVTTAFGKLMGAIDGMAKRYGQYSPQIAMAQAQAEVTHILADIRRSREAGPDLAAFVQAQSQLQQKIEDIKIRFLVRIMPLVISTAGAVERLLPVIEMGFDAILPILEKIPLIGDEVKKVREEMEHQRAITEASIKDFDPLEAIMKGYLKPGSEYGTDAAGKRGRGRPGDPRGVWVPDL